MKASAPPAKSRKKWLIENASSLGFALLLVFTVRSSVIEAFKIPSGSMIPTLLVGDHIFVNKFAYGLKVPFSDLFGGEPIHLIRRAPPKRGDIIVFMFPKDKSYYFIKRVVGIPGDLVEIRNKRLFVNKQSVMRDPISTGEADGIFKSLDDPKYTSLNIEVFRERLSENNHLIMQDKNSFIGENHEPIQIPPDHLFVMGDNRDFSNDSRFWGFVPIKNVKGKAVMIWFSIFSNLSDGQFIFHPERIGTRLH